MDHNPQKPITDDIEFNDTLKWIENSSLTTILVHTAWDDTFNLMPYTTFCMFDYLLNQAHIDYGVYLREPSVLHHYSIRALLDPASDLKDLIVLPGRCTSFALQVIELLESWTVDTLQRDKMNYDFKFYDFENHRTAWCSKTKQLVDSSSLLGSPSMTEWEWLSADTKRHWKVIDGLSKMRLVDGSVSQESIRSYELDAKVSSLLGNTFKTDVSARLYGEVYGNACQ
jgi:hypothetical protein